MKRKWLIHVIILLVIAAIGLGPWVSLAIAGSIASAYGCQLDEGSTHPCIINGQDWGETLYGMALMGGWVGLATCPLSLGLLVLYSVVLILIRISRKKPDETRQTT